MAGFNNPLSDDFLNDVYKGKRETWGDDLIRPRQFVIGRLNTDGTFSTVVTSGEYGRVWVREPGDDAGDAVQAVNTTLQKHEITFNRPVMVKKERGELLIVGKAIQSANYEAQSVNRMQTQTDREQYLVALIFLRGGNDFVVNYKGGMYQINNAKYRVPDKVSSDFTATVPGANALSIKVEIDPLTGTYHETTGTAFTFSTMINAFDNGDLDTTVTAGRFLLGWIRLYVGQTEITNDDILPGEYMLYASNDDPQYVATAPGSDTRNDVKATGDYTGQSWIARAGQTKPLTDWVDANGTSQLQVMPDGDIITDPANLTNVLIGDQVGGGGDGANVLIGQLAGASMTTGFDNTFVGWEAGTNCAGGINNTGVGVDALWKLTSGANCVAMGVDTLGAVTTGIRNVASGDSAFDKITDGSRNTGLGFEAGANSGTGVSDSVAIGNAAGKGVIASHEYWLNNSNGTVPLQFGEFDTGRLGFGTTTPQGHLDVNGTLGAFIPPRMNTAKRDALFASPDGATIYNSTLNLFQGKLNGSWVTLSGRPGAGISAYDTGATITISGTGIGNKAQVTSFDTNDPSKNMTPDHTNDHITCDIAGDYMCVVSISIDSLAGQSAKFGFAVYKNNGATLFTNLHSHRDLPGGAGGNSGSVVLSGRITLAINDTVELWVWNETNTQNIVVDDVTLSLDIVGAG